MKIAWAMILAGALVAGCSTTGAHAPPTEMSVPGVPSPLAVELRTITKDGRSTYHRLLPDGTLEFGGGREAIIRTAQPYGKISAERLKQVWGVIQSRELLAGKGKMFANAESVSYEVRISAGDQQAKYAAVDREVPGLDELDQLLFKTQAEMRYANVVTPIDEKLREQRQRAAAEKTKGP